MGLPAELKEAWSTLPLGADGGPVGLAASTEETVVEPDVRASAAWRPWRALALDARISSSWAVPVIGSNGVAGVISVFRDKLGHPSRDELELVTLYAGYAASAIERDRLLDQVTARNRVLETIREMLETLAGPLPVSDGIEVALDALCRGLQAHDAALIIKPPGGGAQCRAAAGRLDAGDDGTAGSHGAGGARARNRPRGWPGCAQEVMTVADRLLGRARTDDVVVPAGPEETSPMLAVTFAAPGCGAAVIARWRLRPPPADARALLADAARSLRLALEREEALLAHQEAMTLRRSQELQRGFLSRLSHELRTPLTAIRGYASSLMQPDVTWDGESQRRFLGRIAAESARLGRLVDDLLDFSAIESGILRLQQDWCDLPLVLEAAIACLPPEVSPQVKMSCAPRLPVIWADHDRLEQVFVNLLANAIGHNPAGTTVRVGATVAAPGQVAVTVADDGAGLSPEVARAPFESARRRRAPTAGAGLGLSIAKGIVTAHGGRIELVPQDAGTCFRIWLPIEATGKLAPRTAEDTIVAGPVRAETGVA
jgi:signal transduction histidine kinase